MTKAKAIVLFSGGKDSIYSLEKSYKDYEISFLLTSVDENEDTIYTDGSEAPCQIRNSLSQLYQEALSKKGHKTDIKLTKTNKTKTVDDFYETALKLSQANNITTIITGDLGHPDGLDKAFISRGIEALGIKVISPASDYFKKHGALKYIEELIDLGLNIKIIGTRKTDLPKKYIGHNLDFSLLESWKKLENFDLVGEDGEYQSLVIDSPLLEKCIQIKKFKLSPYEKGRDNKNHYYSMMTDLDYEIINKV